MNARHEACDPCFGSLLDLDAPVRQLATGYDFVEGPVWHPEGRFLLFSDIPSDSRHRWDASGAREVARPTAKANGMTFDRELDLLVCEHATSSVVRHGADGSRSVLASRFAGRELNSPNDVVVRSDGSIYFTDPTYGRMAWFGVERASELGFQGVYRLPPGGGELQLLADRTLFTEPNGLCFSPDERQLYVNDSEQANIRAFPVRADGTLAEPRLFAAGIRHVDHPGRPDGMKCDRHGNVWVTGPFGVWVYAPDGRLIGRLSIPEQVANLHWGGDAWNTLFLTATTSLYVIETLTTPRPEPFMSR